jgi:hypothetical protein
VNPVADNKQIILYNNFHVINKKHHCLLSYLKTLYKKWQHRLITNIKNMYSETSIHRFRRGSEKETMDPGKQ